MVKVGTTRSLIGLLRPHFSLAFVLVVLSLADGFFGSLTIAAFYPLFSALMDSQPGADGSMLVQFQHFTSSLVPGNPLLSGALILLIASFLKSVTNWSLESLTGYASGRIAQDLRDRILNSYINGGYPFILDRKQGELVYTLYNATLRTSSLFGTLPLIITQLANIAALTFLLFTIQPKFAMILIGLSAAFHLVTGVISHRLALPVAKRKKDILVQQQILVNEFINGFKQITSYGVIANWQKRFNGLNQDFKANWFKEARVNSAPRNIWEFLIFGGAAISLMIAAMTNPAALRANLATLGVFFVAVQRMIPYLSNLMRYRLLITSFVPDAHAVYSALHDPSANTPPRQGSQAPALTKGIDFENVSFSYPGRAGTLQEVSFQIAHGEMTAIVGGSGSGKTTIVNLLLDLFQPTSGVIRWDGKDVRELAAGSWRQHLGFVSQDTFIFHSSIQSNIAFDRDATRDEIKDVSRLVHADQFIEGFPAGYDTVVGERGMKLSGGQQQRLALARALLKNPEVLILDEATSSLDNVSERLIQDALERVRTNRTVLVVAHRLSTVVKADKIIVLKDGRIVEQGRHDVLLSKGGMYAELYHGWRSDSERIVT